MIPLTALILTYNEQENIGRALSALSSIDQIVIVDSFSTDRTVEIARGIRPDVVVRSYAFRSFADQCNFGLSQITTEWVLSIDADYILTPGLITEISGLNPANDIAGYSVGFCYCVFGHVLRSTVYPARTVLYRRELARYRDEGHGHRVVVDGKVQRLFGKINHDDRKPLSRWIKAQDRYAKIEAAHLTVTPRSQLNVQDRLRKQIFFAPLALSIYLLLVCGLFLDGWRGWYYVFQRTVAELMLSLRLLEQKLSGKSH